MAAAKCPSRGERHYAAKLTDSDVRLIRRLVAERRKLLDAARKLSDAEIGRKFEVHPGVIWKVSSRSGWFHVKD